MNRIVFVILFAGLTKAGFTQNIIDWDGIYQLQLSDFRAKTSQIGDVNMFSLHSSAQMNFAYNMSSYEFMFTKNFNSKVSCTFTRDAASIIAPDDETAQHLLKFAQYEFDLAELYARRFRKKLFDEKGAFSNASFFKPLYDAIHKEFVERYDNAAKETEIGKNQSELDRLHTEVLREIQELSEFCKQCKPTKRKK